MKKCSNNGMMSGIRESPYPRDMGKLWGFVLLQAIDIETHPNGGAGDTVFKVK